MKRSLTNLLRQAMDCCLPTLVRDNYYFMYPFYQYWFAGSPDIAAVINFKEVVQSMNDQGASFVIRSNSLPFEYKAHRLPEGLLWVTDRLGEDDDIHTLLDVGWRSRVLSSRDLPDWVTRLPAAMSLSNCDQVSPRLWLAALSGSSRTTALMSLPAFTRWSMSVI